MGLLETHGGTVPPRLRAGNGGEGIVEFGLGFRPRKKKRKRKEKKFYFGKEINSVVCSTLKRGFGPPGRQMGWRLVEVSVPEE